MKPLNSINEVVTTIKTPFQRFFRIEALGGIILIFSTMVALLWANSPIGNTYKTFWDNILSINVGNFELSKTFLHWINDGLMAIFFFVIGLEIKREIRAGELSTIKQASLPIFAAIGGMIAPALIYIMLNGNNEAASGWGIPMATDIAFSLGVLSLLGKKVPTSLKIFLAAFAIVDDLGAVLIIAFFYSNDLSMNYLLTGLALFTILLFLNRLKIQFIPVFMIIGWIIWYMFLKSGIHPTIAGVLIAFTIPSNRRMRVGSFRKEIEESLEPFCPDDCSDKMMLTKEQLASIDNMEVSIIKVQSPLQSLQNTLNKFVMYIIMPVFALANAGILFESSGNETGFFNDISFNISFSLLFGKAAGIILFSYIAVKTGIAVLPGNINWLNVLGIGFLGGMGFTMSLFIANLAFFSPELLNPSKIGILAGSFFAGITGYLILKFTLTDKENER